MLLYDRAINDAELITTIICDILFSLHISILLVWVIVLFNSSIRLRRKAKYTSISSCNQDAILEALNTKVEYRKSLFLFAIVLSELISSIFTLLTSTETLINVTKDYIKTLNYSNTSNESVYNRDKIINISSTFAPYQDSFAESTNNSDCKNYYYGVSSTNVLTQVLLVYFGIPLILTFSLVYTLMSYYVMVTKKSLNYNISLKSVDLAREQKILLLTSSIACIILMLLLVRIEVYPLFHIVESSIAILQSYITAKYSVKLARVIKWKILDTKIAFGTDHHLFKSYTKSHRKFKLFAFFYNLVVFSFTIHVILRSIMVISIYISPYGLSHLYKVSFCFFNPSEYISILEYIYEITSIMEQIPLLTSLYILFTMNLFSIPYLLSKTNLSCRFNCKRFYFKSNKNLREPLL